MSTTTSKRKAPARRKAVSKPAPVVHWRDDAPCESVRAGAWLSVESREPFMLHFGHDGWQQVTDIDSKPQASGWHAAGIDFNGVGAKQSLEFTRRFHSPRDWEHHDWQVRVDATASGRGKA